MKKLLFYSLFLLFLSFFFSASAQNDLELFLPLPKNIEKITAIQHSIYEGDTTSENYFEYNFDKKGNIVRWHYFTYHMMEDLKYDSLDRILEIDGLYGESFTNGIINYEYPSNHQKVEIHDKMGFYKYIKSDFIFDSMNKTIGETKYDSTINLVDPDNPIVLIYRTNSRYSYDKYGNQVEELYVEDSTKELMYEMHALYNEKKLVNKTEKYSQNHRNKNYATHTSEEYFYITDGEFKDKIEKGITFEINESDSTKSEIQYSYQILDSITTKTDIKYFYKKILNQLNKYFHKNNHLIRLEEYIIPKEENQESKLSNWTKYSYYFYEKNKE
jgi:hypothetical protein